MSEFKDYLEKLIEGKKFKIGGFIQHKDFAGQDLEIVNIHNDNEIYNTVNGVAGISVKDKTGKTFDLWFDTETLRIEKRAGKKSQAFKKITGIK